MDSGEIKYLMKNTYTGPSSGVPKLMKQVLDIVTLGDAGIIHKLIFSEGSSKCIPILEEVNGQKKMSQVLAESRGEYYYNSSENTLLHNFSNFEGEVFSVIEERDMSNVELTSETKTILNFKCYKAIHTQVLSTLNGTETLLTEIWYTPDINIPFGPSKYVGFPGLVVEINHNLFQCRLLTIESKNVSVESLESKRDAEEIISRKEYLARTQKDNSGLVRKMKKVVDFIKKR